MSRFSNISVKILTFSFVLDVYAVCAMVIQMGNTHFQRAVVEKRAWK